MISGKAEGQGRVVVRARAKSALRGLTCGFGGQRPESGLLSHDCAPDLHGQHSAPAQVRATWWLIWRRDGPDSIPNRSLATPASGQVSRPSDDFARALPRSGCRVSLNGPAWDAGV